MDVSPIENPMIRRGVLSLAVLGPLLLAMQAQAWGPDAHHTIGATADRLIAGTYAEEQVKTLLGGLSLQDAAVWADCAKGVAPQRDYAYEGAGKHPECRIFETPDGEAEMIDFVRRNDKNCELKTTENSCHKEYHYSDIAIQHNAYAPDLTGARADDIVGAVVAAIRVLKGYPAPTPFNLKDRREALLALAHYVGDLHQPLHLGAIYLSAAGKPVDPDPGNYDPNTDTRGGNDVLVIPGNERLHHRWDAIPTSLLVGKINAAWLRQAKAIPRTSGAVENWPAAWATETLSSARKALKPLQYGKKHGETWSTRLPPTYTTAMNALKKAELVKAGARLSQILQTIWPCRWRNAEGSLPGPSRAFLAVNFTNFLLWERT